MQLAMEVTLKRTTALVARSNNTLWRLAAAAAAAALHVPNTTSSRPFSLSSLTRPPPNYPGHVPLSRIEKAALAIGSGVMSLRDPRRGGKRTQPTYTFSCLTLPV